MMIEYKVFFKADVFDPVNRVTTNKDFWDSRVIPLSIKVEYVQEVEK